MAIGGIDMTGQPRSDEELKEAIAVIQASDGISKARYQSHVHPRASLGASDAEASDPACQGCKGDRMKTWLVTHTAGGTTWSFGYWLGTAWYQICTVTIPENGESAAGNSDYLEEKK